MKKAKQTGLVQHLVEEIQEAILSGQYKPGDKLPPSRDLETMLGASRGTLREAFRILAQQGLIEVKTGVKGGTFVKQPDSGSVTESLGLLIRQRQISLGDLYGFREVVEEGLIRQVIQKIQPEDIKELNALLDEMGQLVPVGLSVLRKLFRIERRIRGVFIRVSESKMYESVLNAIWDNLRSYADLYLPGNDAMLAESHEDWQIILGAVERKDAESAVGRTKDHLQRFAAHYKRGFDRVHKKS